MQKRSKTFFIDIGNTTTKYTQFKDNALVHNSHIATQSLTKDVVDRLFMDAYCVICSVVPEKDSLFQQDHMMFINHQNIPFIALNVPHPEQVGSDRLVTALAASLSQQGPCLVIDSGTALTFCYIDEYHTYQGGAIFPGLTTSSKALNDYTAKIPLIYVEPQSRLYGNTTKEAVEVGLFQGFKALLNGMIQQYRQLYPGITVVGTGTGLQVFQDSIDLDIYEPELIFQGLLYCYLNKEVR